MSYPGLGQIYDFREGDSRYSRGSGGILPRKKSYKKQVIENGIFGNQKQSKRVFNLGGFTTPSAPQPEYFKPLEALLVYREHNY